MNVNLDDLMNKIKSLGIAKDSDLGASGAHHGKFSNKQLWWTQQRYL